MEKKKTYVLILSEVFPKTHHKTGMPTGFKVKFSLGQGCPDCDKPQDLSGVNISDSNGCINACSLPKLHTIRANYPLWERRIRDIQEGNAVLSVRQWTGKPYCSKQIEIARLTAANGVGIQKLCFPNRLTAWVDYPESKLSVDFKHLAKNDGLSLADWCDWFRHYDLSKPLAIIHFTKFRY